MATYNKLSAYNKKHLKLDRFKMFIKSPSAGIAEVIPEGEVSIEMDREGAPSKISASIVDDGLILIENGNSINFMVDDETFWYGYIFKLNENKSKLVKISGYDQLRYLKNKDTYQYENITYSDLLKRIGTDHGLILGDIEDTKYKIAGRIEEEKEYWEMLEVANQFTIAYTGELFILHDNAGKICLKNIKNMIVDSIVIDIDIAEDYEYESNIDENTYNRIKVDLIDENTNTVRPIIAEDKESIGKYGLLQFYAQTTEKDGVEEKVKVLLKSLNRVLRKFKVKNVFGDVNVRAGSVVPVTIRLRDIAINGRMIVNRVTHRFSNEYHMMDLELYNKDFMPALNTDGLFKNEKSSGGTDPGDGTVSDGGSSGASGKLGAFLDYALAQEGTPYSDDGVGRMSGKYHDCSSLVLRAMRAAGLDSTGANLTTRSIAGDSRFFQISKSQLRKGDILWKSGHMAIYMGNGRTFEAKDYGVPTGYAGNIGRFTRYYRIKGV